MSNDDDELLELLSPGPASEDGRDNEEPDEENDDDSEEGNPCCEYGSCMSTDTEEDGDGWYCWDHRKRWFKVYWRSDGSADTFARSADEAEQIYYDGNAREEMDTNEVIEVEVRDEDE